MRAKARDHDCSFADLFAALAEVALGKPWAAFDRVLTDAHENLPPDVRARLAAYDIEKDPAMRRSRRAGTLH